MWGRVNAVITKDGSCFCSSVIILIIFRCVCIVAKSAYYLCHVRLSIGIFQRGCSWMDFWKFDIRVLLWKSIGKFQIWLKLYRYVRHFTWRPKYILLLPVTLHRHKSSLVAWSAIRMLVHLSGYTSAWLPLGWYTQCFILGTSMKTCQVSANLVKTVQKHRALYMKT
jgi:hypothetical protein